MSSVELAEKTSGQERALPDGAWEIRVSDPDPAFAHILHLVGAETPTHVLFWRKSSRRYLLVSKRQLLRSLPESELLAHLRERASRANLSLDAYVLSLLSG